MVKSRICGRLVFLISIGLLCACGKEETLAVSYSDTEGTLNSSVNDESEDIKTQWEKGYDLPIEDSEKEEAVMDCKAVMETVAEIYRSADKGEASNVVLSDETMVQMKEVIKETGYPAISSETYSVMENYEKMEKFLSDSEQRKAGTIILYEVDWDGGVGRSKYIYDGTDMYVLSARAAWNDANEAMVTYITYTRIKEWKYTEKGWFGYELCVPEPPEVTEIVDGSNMLRVRPMSEECRRLSEKCVLSLGYQGNNLLCSNWDTGSLEKLDYNGVYEYLYQMKYQDRFPSNDYPTGIPAEDFENLIMEFLPVTAEQIRKWAVFDEEHQTYAWERLGCMNYAPNFFGTSLPEVVDVKENKNGTTTLTVEAVCDMVVYSDTVITHELTVQFSEDGSFQYLGNRILNDGIKNIPDYQYRISVK